MSRKPSKKTKYINRGSIQTAKINGQGGLKRAGEYPMPDYIPEESFWKAKPLGRFLSGRTKAGRTVRRLGLGALGVGLGALGLDGGAVTGAISGATSQAAQSGDAVVILTLIKDILLALGAIIAALTKGADLAEHYQRRANETEVTEGKKLLGRKMVEKITLSDKG